ncbi:hypothetical protein L581_3794 [Serratia fonticola AU-AP2C]|nr:hypothetical protein L581_3794 [Serratia fonticola AU-AP2C]
MKKPTRNSTSATTINPLPKVSNRLLMRWERQQNASAHQF